MEADMKKRIVAMIAAGTMIASMIPAVSVYADESKGEAPDYSKKECWCKIPEITKDVDTLYICDGIHYGKFGRRCSRIRDTRQ